MYKSNYCFDKQRLDIIYISESEIFNQYKDMKYYFTNKIKW